MLAAAHDRGIDFLSYISFSNHLEKSLQLLMDRVDDMSQDIVKYNTYSRNMSKQQQQKHQVTLEHTHARTHARALS